MSTPNEINPYARWLSDDNSLCEPAVKREKIDEILTQTSLRVLRDLGPGPRPKVFLNLEHLQVADYSQFEGVTPEQRTFIAKLHADEPIQPEEMIFLALRSLFLFVWDPPESDDDIRYSASYDYHLSQTLVGVAIDLAKEFRNAQTRLPYWGRMAFLASMSALPLENVRRFGLDRVSCTLLKRAKFNATTFALPDALIGLNYALEPILKHLNRLVLHFLSPEHMAGPKRLDRAWNGVAAIVLHFWSSVTATAITRGSTILLHSSEMAQTAQLLTVDQVNFIVAHELGHVAFDHPRRLKEAMAQGQAASLRHEFEFAADAFAFGAMRSQLVERVRDATAIADNGTEQQEEKATVLAGLHHYQHALGSVYLLFLYMDFIQRAGELLHQRLGSELALRDKLDTHPHAAIRLEQLERANMGELLYTSPLERYARSFFDSIIEYASQLSDEAL